MQIPERHFDFKQKDEDLVVLGEDACVQDNGDGPIYRVLNGETIYDITEPFVLLLIKLKQKFNLYVHFISFTTKEFAKSINCNFIFINNMLYTSFS